MKTGDSPICPLWRALLSSWRLRVQFRHVSDLVSWRMEGAAARMVFVDGRFDPQLSTLACSRKA